jgi:hypothetical protein
VLKKTIVYEDFNGNQVSEDFFFHLSRAELVEMELSTEGGLHEHLQKIIAAEDGKTIIALFKDILLRAYGRRSPDGKRFVKNAALREEFESTEAYSALFIELVTDAEKAAEFINGIVPQGLSDEVAKVTGADLAVVPNEPQVVTRAQIREMSQEEQGDLARRIVAGEVKIES